MARLKREATRRDLKCIWMGEAQRGEEFSEIPRICEHMFTFQPLIHLFLGQSDYLLQSAGDRG